MIKGASFCEDSIVFQDDILTYNIIWRIVSSTGDIIRHIILWIVNGLLGFEVLKGAMG